MKILNLEVKFEFWDCGSIELAVHVRFVFQFKEAVTSQERQRRQTTCLSATSALVSTARPIAPSDSVSPTTLLTTRRTTTASNSLVSSSGTSYSETLF